MKFPDWKRARAGASVRGGRLWASARSRFDAGRARFNTGRAWVAGNDPVWRAWRRPGRPEMISGAVAGVLVLAIELFLALFDWN